MLDRGTGTLLAGDLVTLPAPLFDTACPRRWAAQLDALAALPFRRLVPGHGPVLSRAQFLAWRRGFDRVLACAASDAGNPACIDGWLRDAGALVASGQRPLARSLLRYYLERKLQPTATACPA